MGQKTHPYGFRLGYNNTWRSRWYADGKDYANLLHEDLTLRQELLERLENAAVSAIDIERTASKLRVNILSGRPGIIIGRKGAEVTSCVMISCGAMARTSTSTSRRSSGRRSMLT